MKMPYSSAVSCVACGCKDRTFVTEARPGKRMMRCARCGLIFVVPLWTDPVAADIFAHWDGWPEGIVGGADNRTEGMRFIARQIARRSPTGGRLLDIGCADGAFFQAMCYETEGSPISSAWQFYGAEPDPKWQTFDYQNAQVAPQPLRRCAFPDAFFDVVTILDALYYIPEPDRELAEVARILKPGGLLVFDVASQLYLRLRGLVGGVFGMSRTRTFAAYPFYFSDRSLDILLHRAGLRVLEVLADRGAVQQELVLRLLMSVYMGLATGVVKLSRGSLPVCPKSIYLAGRTNGPTSKIIS
jgi:SAM-dependent methyltransferase